MPRSNFCMEPNMWATVLLDIFGFTPHCKSVREKSNTVNSA